MTREQYNQIPCKEKIVSIKELLDDLKNYPDIEDYEVFIQDKNGNVIPSEDFYAGIRNNKFSIVFC